MRNINLFAIGRSLLLVFVLIQGADIFGAPIINEFMADNAGGLADEDGEFPDWIEIHNPDSTALSLAGYYLTDNPQNLTKWAFPAVTLDPGAYLVVFASGKNRINPAGPLHTDFSLAVEGEYLALVAPDEVSVVSTFGTAYPPQFENESFGLSQSAWTFFSSPTPGAANGAGNRAGPIVMAFPKDPAQPAAGPLTISAQVRRANDPVAQVMLYYRKMFAADTAIAMNDNGTAGDALAGDGVYSAIIPPAALAPGEMTRWRFVATDTAGTQTKEPAYRSTTDSHQYFGTVARDSRIQTRLPVLHWFTSNANGADSSSGSRGAVYYDGEFYDNVSFSLHGQSSAGFPKKSYNIDFNRTQRFRWSTNAPRVADIDLLTNWADKSKVRHVLAYEIMREAGVAAHFAYTVRVQQNGSFFSTADFVEDADEIYLERAGLNPEGALYKVYSNLLNKDGGDTANAGVEKKTRKEENNSDLQALIDGLDLTGQNLTRYLYDNIDIPACVNMLAAASVIRNIDMHRKNWYIYRDTGRSGEWAILPWDLDLSQGRVWNEQNTYFDNALYTDGFVVTGNSVRLVAQLFANPAIRAMIMRRIRTLSDEFLQPPPAPGTPENQLYYERRLNEQMALIDPPEVVPSDARRDFEKWGSWLQAGATVRYTNSNVAVETMAEAVQRFKTEYLPARRRYIYERQIVGRGGEIPLPQVGGGPSTNFTALVSLGAPAKVLVPANGNLGLTWTGNPASEPFNTSGWISGTTGVGYERGGGYENLIGTDVNARMQNNNSVYIRVEFEVSDPSAYERLELRMKFDDGFAAYLNGVLLTNLYTPNPLQWNSAATVPHEANPNVFNVYDMTSRLPLLRAGRNVLAIHGLNDALTSSDMIIVPELHGGKVMPPSGLHPKINFGTIEATPASGNQDEEYIQLLNSNSIAVDVSNWRLTGGVEHMFPGGTVIPANGALYVSPNSAAFRARAVSPKGGEGLFVQGGYSGHLSSFAEPLALVEPSGATNATATYQAQPSDVQRHLVVSEVMFHPVGDGLGEFIELLNISSSVTVNLANVRFTQGVDFNFNGSGITTLPPGGRVLVVRDLAAFARAYGTNRPVAGVFANDTALSNSGELIKLEDSQNGTIREFTFDDAAPWPAGADAGRSLVLIAPETNPDHALPSNWRASAQLGGTPGTSEESSFPGDPMGDVNNNGERDLVDYAFGNTPGLPSIFPRIEHRSDLLLVYPSSTAAQNVELRVWYSTNLITWLDATAHLQLVSKVPIGDGRDLVTWRIASDLAEQQRVFVRLQAVPK